MSASMFEKPAMPADAPYEVHAPFDAHHIRHIGNALEQRLADTPSDYRTRVLNALQDVAGSLNVPVEGLTRAHAKIREGANYLLPEVRQDAATEIFTEALANAEAKAATAAGNVAELRTRVNRDTVPTRPETVSDADEAARKTDLQMRLAPRTAAGFGGDDGDELVDRTIRILTEAKRSGDDATVWLLASSEWGRWYLESRGLDAGQLHRFDQEKRTIEPLPEAVADAVAFRDGTLTELERLVTSSAQVATLTRDSQLRAFGDYVRP